VVREKDLELLKLIYASDDHMATASQLAEILNIEHHAPLNSQVGRLGKRTANKLNIEAPKQKKGN
jgi:5-methylcytosine-specific restriction protein A